MSKISYRKNKRGQFFAVYLVVMTIAMCFLAIMIYTNQQKNIQSSVVSPLVVLRLEDKKQILEMREEVILRISAKEALNKGGAWGTSGFLEQVKKDFINSTLNSNSSRDFIFSDLYFQGQKMEIGKLTEQDKENFLNGIYEFSFENSDLKMKRKVFGKFLMLKANERSKINFASDLRWEFEEKTYTIKQGELI